jgi:hypothetical protein
MPKRITIQLHETLDDLKATYHAEHDPITRTHKQAILSLAMGHRHRIAPLPVVPQR